MIHSSSFNGQGTVLPLVTWNERPAQHVFEMMNRSTQISPKVSSRCGIALMVIAIGSMDALAGPPQRALGPNKALLRLQQLSFGMALAQAQGSVRNMVD